MEEDCCEKWEGAVWRAERDRTEREQKKKGIARESGSKYSSYVGYFWNFL